MKEQTLEDRLELYLSEKRSRDVSSSKLLLAASAVAGVGAIIVPAPAEAAIVYSGVLQENNEITTDSPLQIVDFDGNAEFKFKLSFTSYDSNIYSFTQKLTVDTVGTEAVIRDPNNEQPACLLSDYSISVAKPFFNVDESNLAASNTSLAGWDNFLDKQGFLGVKFEIEDNIHYGWIQYKTNADASVGTIIDWAYEDISEKAIKAGATVSEKKLNWNLFLPAIINGN